MALVFEHVGTSLTSSSENGQAALLGSDQEEGSQRKGAAVLAQQGAANAALKLLDDLCMMTTGKLALQIIQGCHYVYTGKMTLLILLLTSGCCNHPAFPICGRNCCSLKCLVLPAKMTLEGRHLNTHAAFFLPKRRGI